MVNNLRTNFILSDVLEASRIFLKKLYNSKMCFVGFNAALLSLVCFSTALLSATALNYLLSLVAIVLFYVYYTHPEGCSENKAFISVNMLLCIGASILSILPKIQV